MINKKEEFVYYMIFVLFYRSKQGKDIEAAARWVIGHFPSEVYFAHQKEFGYENILVFLDRAGMPKGWKRGDILGIRHIMLDGKKQGDRLDAAIHAAEEERDPLEIYEMLDDLVESTKINSN